MLKTIALEGIDGSGKTTVAEHLTEELSREGVRAVTLSPYKLANQELGEDIYGLWSTDTGRCKAISYLQTAFRGCAEIAEAQRADVLIYDRHWMTAFTEIGDCPDLVEAWQNEFVPAALLLVAPLEAARRIRNDRDAPWGTVQKLADYDARYRNLATNYPGRMLGQYRTDMTPTATAVARTINWDMHILR